MLKMELRWTLCSSITTHCSADRARACVCVWEKDRKYVFIRWMEMEIKMGNRFSSFDRNNIHKSIECVKIWLSKPHQQSIESKEAAVHALMLAKSISLDGGCVQFDVRINGENVWGKLFAKLSIGCMGWSVHTATVAVSSIETKIKTIWCDAEFNSKRNNFDAR